MSSDRTTWRREGNINVLYLGEIAVGRTIDAGDMGDKPRWLFNLAGACSFWRYEKTNDQARIALTLALSEWLRKAGLI